MSLPLVEVTWEDHLLQFGETVPTGPAKVTTVGYLVADTQNFVVVALSISDGRPEDMQLIDRRMLMDMEEITFDE